MMKKTALLAAALLLLTMVTPVYADALSENHISPVFHKAQCGDGDRLIREVAVSEMVGGQAAEAEDLCGHSTLIRITVKTPRYVPVSDGFHLKEVYFVARCVECGESQMEIVDSSVPEPHTMVLVTSVCDPVSNTHKYGFVCQDKCGFEEEVMLLCTGVHANDGDK